MSSIHSQIYLLFAVLIVIEILFLFLYIFVYQKIIELEIHKCQESHQITLLKQKKEKYRVFEIVLLLLVFFISILMMVVTTLLGSIQEVNEHQLFLYQWLRYIGVLGAANSLVMVRVQFNQAKRK